MYISDQNGILEVIFSTSKNCIFYVYHTNYKMCFCMTHNLLIAQSQCQMGGLGLWKNLNGWYICILTYEAWVLYNVLLMQYGKWHDCNICGIHIVLYVNCKCYQLGSIVRILLSNHWIILYKVKCKLCF